MLQLSLGYVVQAAREREVAEDLRNRQCLLPVREPRTAPSSTASSSIDVRRSRARVHGTGA